MPPLTRWLLKAAFLYLAAAFSAALLLVARLLWSLPLPASPLSNLFFHLFMVGWLSQLIFGVVYWMFPVFSRDRPRHSPRLGRLTFGLINGGILLWIVAEVVVFYRHEPLWAWLRVLAAVIQFLGALTFVYNSWGRVKGRD